MQKQHRKYLKHQPMETAFDDNDEALITVPQGGALAEKSDDIFDDVVSSGGWLPRLQLMSSNSKPCKSGSFPTNHYALVQGQQLTDLGNETDLLVIDWRAKALEMGDEIISNYDPKSEEFIRIREKSGEQDSGCMFGPEYLVYVPSEKQFALFFMGSASARREAPALKTRLQKAATLKVQMIDGKKHSWAAPAVTPCSSPIDLPDQEAVMEQLEKFNNPQSSDVEVAPEEEGSSEGRAR
jgi:hypothetical protein